MGKQHQTPLIPLTLLILLTLSLIVNVMFITDRFRGMTVVSVYDGDTFVLANGTRVRLMGVDAPETGRCMGSEAKEYLTRLALGRHVRMKNTLTDDYGRLIANVIVEDWEYWTKYITWRFSRIFALSTAPYPSPDPMLNRAMAAAGLAKNLSVSGEYKNVITTAARYAAERKLGIYSDQCRGSSERPGCDIKGNIRQGKKEYYIPGCPYYDQVIVDTSYGDEWFCTASDALTAGYLPSPSCK
jgi:endonuclease YncB( thermonuclease family)